ncbi:cyclic nucleotide-binding/CBS domain-containing protein [Halalkalicoccus tibetensis]|uniref:Cyclic nucleotide-binding/CBS domain-containing protein n=1 Tax=Halalkalicoccus tibetensis TaxID=175632 RepID=A0ABD5VCE5_9EURY
MIETMVETVVSEDARTVEPETPVTEAAQRLRDPTVPALVVLGGDRAVIGIVTESDFVVHVAEEEGAATVGEIMSTPVVTVPPGTPIGFAADRMNEAGVRHLPVVEDGAYAGLVSLGSLTPFLSRTRFDITWKGTPDRAGSAEDSEPVVPERKLDRAVNG